MSPETPAARAWRVVRGVAGPAGLVALALALVFAALGLGLSGRRRAASAVGGLGLVAIVAATAALVAAPQGVAVVATEVRASTAPEAATAGALAPGAVVRLGERRGAWQQIWSADAEGWAPAGSVEAL